MPITVEQAIKQIQAKIQEKGKFNIGNTLDAVLGVVKDNAADLQAMLNKLLNKKGVLDADDEKALQELLAKQAVEKRKRQQIRTKNVLLIGAVVVAVGAGLYFLIKKKQQHE